LFYFILIMIWTCLTHSLLRLVPQMQNDKAYDPRGQSVAGDSNPIVFPPHSSKPYSGTVPGMPSHGQPSSTDSRAAGATDTTQPISLPLSAEGVPIDNRNRANAEKLRPPYPVNADTVVTDPAAEPTGARGHDVNIGAGHKKSGKNALSPIQRFGRIERDEHGERVRAGTDSGAGAGAAADCEAGGCPSLHSRDETAAARKETMQALQQDKAQQQGRRQEGQEGQGRCDKY
jgi:hypothetical protein